MRSFLRALALALLLPALIWVADFLWLYSKARATVTSASSSITLLGNGSTTVFSFPFVGVAASDIVVTYTDTTGAQTVLNPVTYTLALAAPPAGQLWGVGGTVTYPLAGSAIASGTTLTIARTLPYTQTVSSNQGQRFALSIEAALDVLAMQVQQVNAVLGLAIQAPATDTCAPLGQLPGPTQRANQIIGFDSTGCNPIAAQPSSALVSAAMQPVVAAATINAANTLLGINTNFNIPVGMEADWPGLTAPAYWKLENGAAISRTTYAALLAVIAPVAACTIANGSSTITGIASTLGWGTGWIIESPGSSALGSGRTIASVAGNSVTIAGGAATANASSCQIFPYGTAQDGTFNLPQAAGVVYAGLDSANAKLNSTYCTGNPAYLAASCGSQSDTLITGNLPAYTPAGTVPVTDPGHTHTITNGTLVVRNNGATGFNNIGGSLGGSSTLTNVSATTGVTAAFTGTAQGGTSTPFSLLQPTQIRNKIIFAGAP